MPKSRGRRTGKPASRAPRRPQRRESREPGLFEQVAAAAAEDHPLALLGLASGLLNALDPRNGDPFNRTPEPDRPPLAELLETFLLSGEHEGVILAWTMAHLLGDELVLARTLRSVGEYADGFPRWLRELDRLEVVGAEEIGDELRDSFNLIVHTRLAGHDLTPVALVDFNLGTIVKDCFFADRSLDEFNVLWRAQDGAATAIRALPLADVRARIEEAIETGARTWPPAQSDDWPASRPLLEWVLRSLPAGGTGFERPEWSEAEQDQLVALFLASPYAPAPGRPDDRSIAGDLLWYRTGYGYGDPLRWSATALEILLLDWYPRKIMADQAYLRRMPTVLDAFIRFAHAEAGIDPGRTDETLAALAAFTPDYLKAVGQARRQGPEALMERMGLLNPLAAADDPRLIDHLDLAALSAEMLAELVGGHTELAALTAEPLPDEPFVTEAIPAAIAARVAETVALADACCDGLLDTEHRTAVRRLLHDVAVRAPTSFDGRSRPRTAAAGLCWMVGRANETVGHPGLVETQELMAWFGLKAAPTARAASIRRALGIDQLWWPAALGSTRYLTGERRHSIIAARDGDS